ncbi:MAG TPA: hypothetical protein VNL15_00845 [Dehalococcoidia bacterium]|nr:hypothetical protein [Dehalococcoidia bacterium]
MVLGKSALLSDPGVVEAITSLLDGRLEQAPFELKGSPVYQLRMHSEEHGQEVLITLWPQQARVDVRLGKSYWVLKDISAVELYPGVEVLFRRQDPSALLFVSTKGRVALVT